MRGQFELDKSSITSMGALQEDKLINKRQFVLDSWERQKNPNMV